VRVCACARVRVCVSSEKEQLQDCARRLISVCL